ncbi:MAG: ferritin-like domain-containing protein [Methylobacter sp.]|nr:ferritin-like domain-containing protein [Methylobacter sp.]
MNKHTQLGMNRTGIQMSPLDTAKLKNIAAEVPPDVGGNSDVLAAFRGKFVADAEPIGSVPVPGNLKGLVGTAMEKLTGHHIEVLVDKLGERLAFERTGVRLYEAILAKTSALEDISEPLVQALRRFRNEELVHFELVKSVLLQLGADPTAQTPCADAAGVASSGILKAITDPRTTLAQSLDALLAAELIDNAGWELLIKLAGHVDHTEWIEQFQLALKQEAHHLATVRLYVENEILRDSAALR